MNTLQVPNDPELAIWERVFVPDTDRVLPEQARYLLDVRFPRADIDRIKWDADRSIGFNYT